MATGSLHKTPNIHEGKGGLEDKLLDKAHDNVLQHDRRHGTKDNPMPLVPTFKGHDICSPLMDIYARNLGGPRMEGCILLHR